MGWLERTQTVVAPDSHVWTVRRVLLPRPPRWWGKKKEQSDTAPPPPGRDADDNAWVGEAAFEVVGSVGDLGDALPAVAAAALAIALVIAVLTFAWFVVFPVLLLLGDLLLILLIAAGGVAVRVLFRRPWKIEARRVEPPQETHTWGVVGVRASSEAVKTVAYALSRGTPAEEIRLAR
jgi:hypothetical protein